LLEVAPATAPESEYERAAVTSNVLAKQTEAARSGLPEDGTRMAGPDAAGAWQPSVTTVSDPPAAVRALPSAMSAASVPATLAPPPF
jgi:hypothetical protein